MLSCSLLAKVHKITVKITNPSQNYFLQDCIKTNIFVHQILNDMKRQFTFLALSAACILASQFIMADVIVLADGTSKQCYNVEAAKKWIYYTETDAEDAPVQRIAIDEVFAYKIGDGKMQVIGEEKAASEKEELTSTVSTSSVPVLGEAVASDDNPFIIDRINSSKLYTRLKPKDKIYGDGYIATLWGITNGSILDDGNVNISFVEQWVNYVGGYRIRIYNKTDQPLYVDLANSFHKGVSGDAKSFFTNSVYTTSQGGSTGVGVNLGYGVSVASGASKGTTVSQVEQQILVVPPKSSALLPGDKVVSKDGVEEYPMVFYFWNSGILPDAFSKSGYTNRYVADRLKNNKASYDYSNYTATGLGIKENALTEFSEAESPKTEQFIITYSTNPDFATYYQLPVGVYLRGIFGQKQGWNIKGEARYWTLKNEQAILGVGNIIKK